MSLSSPRIETQQVPPQYLAQFLRAEAFVRDIQENNCPIASGKDSIGDVALLEEIWKKELRRTKSEH